MSLAHLLSAARFVQRNSLHDCGIGEVSGMWIVEGYVPVLAESDETQINGCSGKQFGVTSAFPFDIGGVACEVMRPIRMNDLDHLRAQPPAKAGRMIGTNTNVLIQMEYIDALPIEFR